MESNIYLWKTHIKYGHVDITMERPTIFNGKKKKQSTISMEMFHVYVELPEGIPPIKRVMTWGGMTFMIVQFVHVKNSFSNMQHWDDLDETHFVEGCSIEHLLIYHEQLYFAIENM